MNPKPYPRVVIVGCGFAGTALALFLKRAGICAEIYEARQETELDAGAFLYLAPNGVNVLKALGLETAVKEAGYATTGIRLYNRRGRAIGEIDNRLDEARFGAAGHVIKRRAIFKLLQDEVTRQGVPVHFDKPVTDIKVHGEKLTVFFREGETKTGDLLIGADGVNSTTRRLIFPGAPSPSYLGLIDTGGFTTLPELTQLSGPQHMVFGKKAFFGYTVKPDGEVYWFSNVPWAQEPSREDLSAILPDVWKARLLELHAQDPDPVTRMIQATPARTIGKWVSRDLPVLSDWHTNHVCLLGDAAHALPPTSGQGASVALEDAAMLAKCLRDLDARAAFKTFQGLRKKRIERMAQHARQTSDGKIPNVVVGLIRDLLLPTLIKAGGKAQREAYGYTVDWAKQLG